MAARMVEVWEDSGKWKRVMIASVARTISSNFVPYSLECFLADIDASGCARCFGATSQIHRIPKETITRHAITNNTGDNFARMNANGDLLWRRPSRCRENEKRQHNQVNDNNNMIKSISATAFRSKYALQFYNFARICTRTERVCVCGIGIACLAVQLTSNSEPIWTLFAISIMSNDSLAIHFAWFSHASGMPDTAMYLSPTVSTYTRTQINILRILLLLLLLSSEFPNCAYVTSYLAVCSQQ